MFAIGERYKSLLTDGIREYNLDVLWLPDNPLLDKRLSGHADLNICAADSTVVISRGQKKDIVKKITDRGINVKQTGINEGKNYPYDCSMCLLDTGKYLFYNPKTADPGSVELFKNRIPVPVSQGYTRCAAAVIKADSIVTADPGVSAAAKRAGLKVLDIKSGFIDLPGFSYGFIGGASFLLNNKTIAFTGTLDRHPDKDNIYRFLNEDGIIPVFLRKEPIIDIGGVIPLP